MVSRLAVLGVLVAWAGADEVKEEPNPYAALGFPVTINEEIITANDAARAAGIPLEQIPLLTLERQRDILLNRKISERVAAELEIEVTDREVEEWRRIKVEELQGEAKFYEQLAQQGITLERFKLERRQEILEQKLQFLFQTGISPDHRSLLPARVRPTPRELQIAFESDPARLQDSGRVRRLEMVIDVDERMRKKLTVERAINGKSEEWVQEQIHKALAERVEEVEAALETEPFDAVARRHGTPVETQQADWVPLVGSGEAERFLATAEEKTWSPRIRRPQGGYRYLYLIERERPNEREVSDPAVAAEYDQRIRKLRADKWDALLRIRALESSHLSPDRVRSALRQQYLAQLRDAEAGLRRLGLH